MIPILFSKNATTFTKNGQGALVDAISCTVTEERNGMYELQLTYPQSGIHFADIEIQSIICAIPHDGGNLQPFRVYRITKPMNGKVDIYAQHISYQLSSIPCMPFGAISIVDCFAKFIEYAAEACPFTFWTDKSTVAIYTQETPASIRERLGGVQGSVLDTYGGEFEFDNYTVKLWNHRGADRGVTLRYGKNIVDIKQEENISTTYTGICPFWRGGEDNTVVTLPEKVVESEYADNFPYRLTKVVDMTQYFMDEPTVAQLRARAEQYVEANAVGVPAVSIDVNFVALWQTEEYKDVSVLQRVYLCDTVTVIFEKLGVNAKAKVIKTVYDVIKERYSSISLGSYSRSLADTIADMQNEVVEQQASLSTRLSRAIQSATDQITGQNGGYIVTRYDGNDNPYEILIMDTPDINTAQKVWRWNNAGLGFSSTGYNGPYGTAITQDGKIVADFITAGTMSANRISGGTLELGGEDNDNGQIFIYDANGNRCGQITNAGIAIYSPNNYTQVIISPDIGLVQRDSQGNIYYGLSDVQYPTISAVYNDKYMDYKSGVSTYQFHVVVADKQTDISYGVAGYKYKFRYYWSKPTNPYWNTTIIKRTGVSRVVVTLPEIFRDKNISVSVVSEGYDASKIAGDTAIRGYVYYNPNLPLNKADGTEWTDTSWSATQYGINFSVGEDVTYAVSTMYPSLQTDVYATANAYAGSSPSELVLPDPSSYYVAMTQQDLGAYDPDNTQITYTLDSHNGTITIDLEAYSENGYSVNEIIKLRVVAIC